MSGHRYSYNVRGILVQHRVTGKKGRTYHGRTTHEDKVVVYWEKDDGSDYEVRGCLVTPTNLTIIGYID